MQYLHDYANNLDFRQQEARIMSDAERPWARESRENKKLDPAKRLPGEIERIQHSLFVDKRTLMALLRRCGHTLEGNVDIKWAKDGAIVNWDSPIL